MAARIQGATGTVAAGTSYTITLTSFPTDGNVIVLGSGNNQGALASVSQTGVTWTSRSNAGFNFGTDIWVGAVGPGAGKVITVTLPVSGRGVGVAVEWSGFLSPTDAVNETHGTSTTIASSSITPTADEALALALGVAFTTITGGPTGGFTNDLSPAASASFNIALAYLVQGTAAAAQATWTIASNAWDGTIISLLPAAAAPQGPPDLTVSSVVTDGFLSTHMPPWFSPQNRFGRLNSAGQPFTIPLAAASFTAETTTGTGAAADAQASISASASLASGTGAAQNAAIPTISVSPSAATGTGVGSGASESVANVAGLASGTGAVPTSNRSVSAPIGVASGTGLAPNAAVTSTSPQTVLASSIGSTGTGSAGAITASIAGTSQATSGTGVSAAPSASVAPSALLVSGTGSAFAPSMSVKASAGIATATGVVWIATDGLLVSAQLAAATGAAYAPGRSLEAHPSAATGTGRSWDVLAAGPTTVGGPPPSIAMVVSIRPPLEIR